MLPLRDIMNITANITKLGEIGNSMILTQCQEELARITFEANNYLKPFNNKIIILVLIYSFFLLIQYYINMKAMRQQDNDYQKIIERLEEQIPKRK